jgi:heme exporter protein CcmD
MPNFDLGKYTVYIVPAYLITAAVVCAMVADTLLRTARWRREVEKREAARKKKKA